MRSLLQKDRKQVIFRSFILPLMWPALLAGCATGPALVGGADVRVLATHELPAPQRANVAGGSESAFYLGPFDKISLTVFGIDELNIKEIQVDASGRISVPLVGTLEAADKTPGDLATLVENGLRKYVRNPQVAINVVETVSSVVTVDGQVREPGLYPVVGKTTLMQAIATAKGVTEFARLREVVVFRKIDQQQFAAVYNLDAIRKGAYADPRIYADDIVVVGDSPARRMFKDLLQVTPLITTPLVTLIAYRR